MLFRSLTKRIGVDQPVFLFELKLDPLQRGVLTKYHTVSRFPATRRDLALVVNEEVSASRVVEEIRRVAGQTLSQLQCSQVVLAISEIAGNSIISHLSAFLSLCAFSNAPVKSLTDHLVITKMMAPPG